MHLIVYYGGGLCLVAALAGVIYWLHRLGKSTEGEWRTEHFFRKRTLIDGTSVSGILAVRSVGGKKEYRPPNPSEVYEYNSDWAW